MNEPGLLDEPDRHEVLWRTYLAVQREQQASGAMPRFDSTVLSRLSGLLALLGAVQLGVLVSCFGVLMVFVVTRMILHLDFARYLGG